ncbi:MAM and LDL-receptor class A domain-containing protein 1-like [Lytechinus variegatus]|uniref:MAM and LDL-receptor class A domain-containing protein 1-like n=1 Tax=Lytechinus variegatus TaxID=7654 RepID=UPI001BB1A0A8|nr:MAM and LDL-receptor class A domain-containing protein 1-like [Lytechinus variegatus]
MHDNKGDIDLGLESGVFPQGDSSERCLNVWFYMTNSRQVNLKVIQVGMSTGNDVILAVYSGLDFATEWHVIQKPITVTEDFTILFKATVLAIPQDCSVSIDDFKVMDGPCPPAGSCDFETGFCTWKNEENSDDFDWQLIQGGTPTDYTGPPSDHTKMKDYGTYAYIGASSRTEGDFAILKSPDYESGPTQCLELYYCMYGSDMGKFEVQLLQDKSIVGSTLRSYIGNQGEGWRQLLVTLDVVDGSLYSVLLNATVGNDINSDIAVDDINFYPGNCSGRSDICDFSHNFCDWAQGTDDETDWLLGSGSDSRYGNNEGLPDHSTDHVGGGYAYIDMRDAENQPGDRARLVSMERTPPIDGQAECLGFWYHLDENDVGSLNVTVKWVDNGTLMLSDSLWSISGNRGDEWWFGAATVISKFPYQAIIEGTIGTASKGGITIDDVGFSSGPCDPPGHCSFERNMCSWQSSGNTGIDGNDGDDWLRASAGRTMRGFTGPANDHTQGTVAGFYAQADATFTQDKTPTLFSEVFDPSSEDGDCFAFWYHMNGTGEATLRVYYQQFNPPATYDRQEMFSASGNQGDVWLEHQFDLTSDLEFQIIFYVEYGSSDDEGYNIDVAIDDTSLTTTKCSEYNQWHCTFEDGLCGYTQAKDDDRDWTRRPGSTPSFRTGPDFDHTIGNVNGYYIYLEASPGRAGEKTRLLSPFAPAGKYCVGFWFHMYGQSINTLNVYIQRNNTALDLPVWTRTGSSGNQWKEGYIDVVDIKDFRVVYEAIKGRSFTGDIAIDDLDLIEGQCKGTHTCDFQSDDLCGYQQETGKDDFDWIPGSGSTLTPGTGPAVDHTYSTSYGRYMYIDSSEQAPGDKAQFYTKTSEPDPSGFACWTFFYYMKGAGVDELRILVCLK